MRLLLTLAMAVLCCSGISQNFLTEPYLEHAEPTHIHVSWITDSNSGSIVEWGLTEALGNSTVGTSFTTLFADEVHEVELNGLTPATKYFYRAVTGPAVSEIKNFHTPPLQSAEAPFNLVAMSDMQIDGSYPQRFSQIVNDGILPIVQEVYGDDLSENLGLVLIPGDLVTNGLNYGSWMIQFFNPAEDLFSYVPLYPVLGNHEANTPYYFDFFHLPENGSAGNEERWWYKDYSNVRVIGLDSNSPFDGPTQLAWLQNTLNQTCSDSDIDFVFVELHHPHQSELWTPGESSFTTDVVTALETFSTNCDKPSIHFFGHTHGYSRGQSKDHDHVMVNVATAGGAIDQWGEWPQFDYPDFTVSQAEWGFVMLEVEAGANPQFKLKRYSQGNQYNLKDNEVTDSIVVKLNNLNPVTPIGVSPDNEIVDPSCLLLVGNMYDDPDDDIHMASEWQISTSSTDFSAPVYESFKTHENWYFFVDTQADDILVDENVSGLPSNTTLFWRVRYRDHSLGWSGWSAPLEFQTSTATGSPNLVINPGAESGISNWTVDQGVLESLVAFDCAGTSPNSGTYYFAIGGLCIESDLGIAHQDIDLTAYSIDINAGGQFAYFGAFMSDYAGDDVPEIQVEFLDVGSNVIGTTPAMTGPQASWQLFEDTQGIPVGTTTARFYMRGYRNGGVDNDSYVDDIFFHVTDGTPCDQSMFDEDNDGVIDSIDNCLGLMNPAQADFDEDGIGDDCEDSDGDGLLDAEEIGIYGSDPAIADTDSDGLNDYEEAIDYSTNPLLQDSDGDGLTDWLEINLAGTDPNNPDTDGDGCNDELEYNLACPDNMCNTCPADLDGNLLVDTADLLMFLSAFGLPCP